MVHKRFLIQKHTFLNFTITRHLQNVEERARYIWNLKIALITKIIHKFSVKNNNQAYEK